MSFLKKIWKWFVESIKDKTTRRIFIVVWLTLSSPIWMCYIIGFICKSAILIGFATGLFAFWSLPFTPFLEICLVLTLVIKKILNKRRDKSGESSYKCEEQ